MKKLSRKSLDELAKIVQVIDEEEQREYIGGGSGTPSDPYTQVEFDSLCDAGFWSGGYVKDWGYVAKEAFCTATSIYSGSATVVYYDTFADYLRSLSTSPGDLIAQILLGEIPVVGAAVTHYSTQYGNMTRDMQAELLENGYSNSSSFIASRRTTADGGLIFSVYNGDSGSLITSRTMNKWGNWY